MSPQEIKLITNRLWAIKTELAREHDGEKGANTMKLISELMDDIS